ncbi:protein kinase [Streptomyces sp. NBC_01336]|uniref:protein kinase domain-containing protein n=1 Tax=Streptomyces sp. NBC_01336 TaxID=2903829 RepID=UPI002E152AE2|nr:protein kinase [Streptomyces sp. NBC_01336]
MGLLEALEPQDPRQVGRYKIVARLGAGGMGQVYLARSPGGRPVAVKVVRPELARDGEFRRRFAREAVAAARVNGAFTAGVVDADPDGFPAWLATVYVPGVSLGEAIAGHGPWPTKSVLALGAGLAEALEAIHAAGVVHRDLKPSNVLLAVDGPRVIDFGISVAVEASALTSTGMAIGTPGFMSPEQLTGDPIGPASDVFALGAVLTYTATGVGPFGTGASHALHFRTVYEAPNLELLSPELRPVVAACLDKQPDRRPTVATLLDRLATAGGSEGADAVAATPLLTEPGWMPAPVAQLVREHTSTSMPHTPPTPPPPPETPPSATTQTAPGIQRPVVHQDRNEGIAAPTLISPFAGQPVPQVTGPTGPVVPDQDLVRRLLDDMEVNYTVDEEGDLTAPWAEFRTYFMFRGEDDQQVFSVRTFYDRPHRIDDKPQLLETIAEWNRRTLWPKVYSQTFDDGSVRLVGETQMLVSTGVSLEHFVSSTVSWIRAAVEFDDWLVERLGLA